MRATEGASTHPGPTAPTWATAIHRFSVWLVGAFTLALGTLGMVVLAVVDTWPDWSLIGYTSSVVTIGFVASVVALKCSAATLRRLGRAPRRCGGHYQQYPRVILIVGFLWVFVAAVIMTGLAGQETARAFQLGPSPAQATATTVREWKSQCQRCVNPRVVTFNDSGARITAVIPDSGFEATTDVPGLPLVYDAQHPDRVLRASDWASGQRYVDGRLFLAAGLLLTTVVAGMAQIGRRRRMFGMLKPGVAIGSIQRSQDRGTDFWRVEFTDGSHTKYVGTPAFCTALLAKLTEQGPTGLAMISGAQLEQTGK